MLPSLAAWPGLLWLAPFQGKPTDCSLGFPNVVLAISRNQIGQASSPSLLGLPGFVLGLLVSLELPRSLGLNKFLLHPYVGG